MCRCSLWLNHGFDAARRKPEGARIDPIRIKLQYLVEELSRGRRRPGYAVEIMFALALGIRIGLAPKFGFYGDLNYFRAWVTARLVSSEPVMPAGKPR